jgi:hypothetical protein
MPSKLVLLAIFSVLTTLSLDNPVQETIGPRDSTLSTMVLKSKYIVIPKAQN